jgi:hypothetical protein
VLAPQFFQYFFIALMGPLVFARRLMLVKFIAEAIFVVAHISPKMFAMCRTFISGGAPPLAILYLAWTRI